jgi:hypothetical protein
VIPKAHVTLQKPKGEGFQDIEMAVTDERGRFEFAKTPHDTYRVLVVAPRGFCQVAIPVKLSGRGWDGLKLAVPIAATHTSCDDRLKIEGLEP